MEEPIIIWQKWQDELVDELDNVESEFEDAEESDDEHHHEKISKQLVMITPMGILPYNSANICMKNFNLWLGHTNFSLSSTIASLLESVDGVETLDIFTRYRFRIGVGKAFTDSVVMRDINTRLYDYIYEHNT